MRKLNNQFFYKNNRLQQLRGFCAVMQLGSILKAAEYMGLSHTAISLQIKSLEEDLKINLFEKAGAKNKPTKDAEILYKIAIIHVEGINDIYNEFVTQKDNASTEIVIAANNAAITNILPKLLKHHTQDHPGIYYRISFAEHEDGLEKLKRDEIDVLLIPRRENKIIDPEYYVYTPLFYYAPVLFTLPDHPLAGKKNLTMKEICKYEITMPSKTMTVVANLYDVIQREIKGKRFRLTFEDWWVIKKYIETGLAISISADMSHEGKRDLLTKTSLLHLFPVIDYGFVTKKNRKLDRNLQSLFDTAKKYGKELSSDLL